MRPAWWDTAARAAALRIVVLVAVALVTRGQQLGNPIVHIDEEFYLFVGRHMAAGAIPYVDIWDRKPIGLFLIYWFAARLGGDGVLAYQLLASGFAVATAETVARIARRIAAPGAALLSGILYLLYIPLLTGQGGQSPVFYNLFVALAALAVIRSAESARADRGVGYGVLAMLLVGIALQIKTSVVFEGIAFGIALLWIARRRGATVPAMAASAMLWVAAALVPTLIAMLVYWRIGHFSEFWFANFVSIFKRHALAHNGALRNATTLSLYTAPLVIAATRGAVLRYARSTSPIGGFVTIWFGVAVAAVVAFGYYFDHYGLPIVVPASASAATMFADRRHRVWSAVLLLGALAGCLVLPSMNQARRGTPAQFARLVAAIRPYAPCGLLVWDDHSALYDATGAPRLTRYPFPTHLREPNETGAIGIDQASETRRLLALRPAVVVIERKKKRRRPIEGTSLLVVHRLATDYRPLARIRVGRRDQIVYVRTDMAPPHGLVCRSR